MARNYVFNWSNNCYSKCIMAAAKYFTFNQFIFTLSKERKTIYVCRVKTTTYLPTYLKYTFCIYL